MQILSYDIVIDLYIEIKSANKIHNRGIAYNLIDKENYDFIDFKLLNLYFFDIFNYYINISIIYIVLLIYLILKL